MVVKAHIFEGGPFATLELSTPEAVVDYIFGQESQPAKWEISGTPEEEAEVERLVKDRVKCVMMNL